MIYQSGIHLLEAIGYTGEVRELSVKQHDLIASMQGNYYLVVEEVGKEVAVLLAGKKSRHGKLNLERFRAKFFSEK